MMNEFDSIRNKPVDQLRCEECGHTCFRHEFIQGLSLCIHLALDALAARQAREA